MTRTFDSLPDCLDSLDAFESLQDEVDDSGDFDGASRAEPSDPSEEPGDEVAATRNPPNGEFGDASAGRFHHPVSPQLLQTSASVTLASDAGASDNRRDTTSVAVHRLHNPSLPSDTFVSSEHVSDLDGDLGSSDAPPDDAAFVLAVAADKFYKMHFPAFAASSAEPPFCDSEAAPEFPASVT